MGSRGGAAGGGGGGGATGQRISDLITAAIPGGLNPGQISQEQFEAISQDIASNALPEAFFTENWELTNRPITGSSTIRFLGRPLTEGEFITRDTAERVLQSTLRPDLASVPISWRTLSNMDGSREFFINIGSL